MCAVWCRAGARCLWYDAFERIGSILLPPSHLQQRTTDQLKRFAVDASARLLGLVRLFENMDGSEPNFEDMASGAVTGSVVASAQTPRPRSAAAAPEPAPAASPFADPAPVRACDPPPLPGHTPSPLAARPGTTRHRTRGCTLLCVARDLDPRPGYALWFNA